MKKLLGILILSLFLITPSQAGDIRDFQIEGMSIGDSLLDYVSKEEIKNNKHYYPKSKKWALFVWKSTSFENYEGVQVHIKDDGEKYIIGTIEGHLYYENNIKDCYKKRKQIIAEVSEIFKDAKKKSGKRKHSKDKSGKSIVSGTNYSFKSGDHARISCTDWSSAMNKIDKLVVRIGSKEFLDWIENEAF